MSGSLAPEAPRRPAEAYALMEEILGSSWFVKNAPTPVGIELSVCASDSVTTVWRLSHHVADHVVARVQRHPGLRVVAHRAYDDRKAQP